MDRTPRRAGPTPSSEIVLHALAATPLLAQFSEPELLTLAGSVRPRAFPDGAVVFHRDDPGNGLYVILAGTIKISLTSHDGQETLIALLGTGECVGEMAVLDGRPRSATATAMERTETLYLPRDGFLNFLDAHPQAMRTMLTVLSQRLRDTDEDLADLVFQDVYGRLAKRLLELGASHGQATPGGIEITLAMTQQELASMVGASRESVHRAIKLYRNQGYVAVAHGHITLLRPEELRRRAELS